MTLHEQTIEEARRVMRVADTMAHGVDQGWGVPGSETGRFMEAALNNVFEGMPFPLSIVEHVTRSGMDVLQGTRYEIWHNDPCLKTWVEIVQDHVSALKTTTPPEVLKNDIAWEAAVKETHRAIFGNVDEQCGEYRTVEVGARNLDGTMHRFPSAETVGETIREGVKVVREAKTGWATGCAVEYLIVTVHPFRDGNGRVSRKLGNDLNQPWGRRLVKPMHKPQYIEGLNEIRSGGSARKWLTLLKAETEDATSLADLATAADAIADWARTGRIPEDLPATVGEVTPSSIRRQTPEERSSTVPAVLNAGIDH